MIVWKQEGTVTRKMKHWFTLYRQLALYKAKDLLKDRLLNDDYDVSRSIFFLLALQPPIGGCILQPPGGL